MQQEENLFLLEYISIVGKSTEIWFKKKIITVPLQTFLLESVLGANVFPTNGIYKPLRFLAMFRFLWYYWVFWIIFIHLYASESVGKGVAEKLQCKVYTNLVESFWNWGSMNNLNYVPVRLLKYAHV